VFLGLPLVLMPEEVVLLIEKGAHFVTYLTQCILTRCAELAILVDDASAHLPPTGLQLEDYALQEQEEIARQMSITEARQVSEAKAKGADSEAAQRKRLEREQKRAAKAALAGEDASTILLLDASHSQPLTSSIGSDTPTGTSASVATPSYVVQIPTSSSSLAWYNTGATTSDGSPGSKATYDTLAAARAAGIWTYPSTETERARCAAFRDLWENGNFMGGGIKFGGDWLVYPGWFCFPLLRLCRELIVLQAILCVITRILWRRQYESTSRCVRWRLLHMDGWGQRQRRATCSVL
jgi:tRNA-splicing endonuclease subunit Sen34